MDVPAEPISVHCREFNIQQNIETDSLAGISHARYAIDLMAMQLAMLAGDTVTDGKRQRASDIQH